MAKEYQSATLIDALFDFDGGVNQTRSPLKLDPNIMAHAVNVTVRNDFATHRPPYNKRILTYENDVTRAMVEGGLFQGACFYIADSPPPSLIAAISGRLFQFTIVLNTVNVALVDGGVTQDPNVLQAWLWQAENYVIWNDGINNPVFFDGSTCIQSDFGFQSTSATFVVPAIGSSITKAFATVTGIAIGSHLDFQDTTTPFNSGVMVVTDIGNPNPLDVTLQNINGNPGDNIATPLWTGTELPPGRMGVYGLGRVWESLIDGRQFIASDVVAGSSGTPSLNGRDAVLQMTENSFLASGGTFVVPGALGAIQAMIFTATLDASLGQGPLQVLTDTTVFSCNTPTDRTTWQTVTNPILTQSLITNGGKGQNSTVSANGDIMFRAIDGIRSLILGRRDFDVWGNCPISYEVDDILRLDDPGLLRYGSAMVHDNRLLMTTHPIIHPQGIYWKGLVPLNFDPVSTLRGKLPSVYDSGIWTGINVLQLVLGQFNDVERGFAFVLNTTTGATKIELWELMDDGAYDNDGLNDIPIIWNLRSASLKFGQTDPRQRQLLALKDGEIYIEDLIGQVDFVARYWPDQYPCPVPWFAWSECQLAYSPTLSKVGFRPRMGMGEPSGNPCDVSNNRPLREFYTFQYDLTVTGHCRFLGGRFKAVTQPQPEFAPQQCSPVCGLKPNKAVNPQPANLVPGIPITNVALSWSNGGRATSYNVYFNGVFQGNQTGTSFFIPTSLYSLKTYSWRIDSVNASGITTGDTWSFTTGFIPLAYAPVTAVATWTDKNGSHNGDLATFQSTADAATVSLISIVNQNLTSISNLQSFPALAALDISFNQLTALDVTGCNALTRLTCNDNLFTSFDATGAPELTELLIFDNAALTTLKVIGMTALDHLDCSFCGLSTLNVSGCVNLTFIACDNNASLASINLTVCPRLDSLLCNSCAITALDFSGCTLLTQLICYNNPIVSLDVTNCQILSIFHAFSSASLTTVNATGCTFLTSVLLYNCALSVATVNAMLVVLDAEAVVGAVDLSAQTPAAPPDAGPPDGAAAKASLITKGWAVTTD